MQNPVNNYPYPNVSTNHPLIHNSQNYYINHKYVAIHSQDRDVLKYPNSSAFEIELPQDIMNVSRISAFSWSFPANYSTFSGKFNNVTMTFKIDRPYNPLINNNTSELQIAIFEALEANKDNNHVIQIDEGDYTPQYLQNELTNKFNYSVSRYIISYFEKNNYKDLISEFNQNGQYTEFVFAYNSIKYNMWVGNQSSGFILTNSTQVIENRNALQKTDCGNTGSYTLPDYSNYGLPKNLGFIQLDQPSINVEDLNLIRFFHNNGDAQYWLTPNPDLSGCVCSYIEGTYKSNFLPDDTFYMEINGYNSIDETSPYDLSKFTIQTNQTNGVANSAFFQFNLINNTPLSYVTRFFSNNFTTYFPTKYFNPPQERIRKLFIKIRWHDGTLVDFGIFNWNVLFEFCTLVPEIKTSLTTKTQY